MTHFSVLVCLPSGTDLEPTRLTDTIDRVMHRWSAWREVEPRRSYAEGAPEEHWSVGEIRDNPDDPEDARLIERLGENPTWETVAEVYNAKYADVEPAMHVDPASGRAYLTTTANPDAEWDSWDIGGRWKGRYPALPDAARLIHPSPGHDGDPPSTVRCDGGVLEDLDLGGMRDTAEAAALDRYLHWQELAAAHPPAEPFTHFAELADAGQLTWQEAGRRYRSQPLVRAAKELAPSPFECVVSEFLPSCEEYVQQARRAAVLGYALVTLEQEWIQPGAVGWFGTTMANADEFTAYTITAHNYLERLDPGTVLVILDCHF